MARGFERPPLWAVILMVVSAVALVVLVPLEMGRGERSQAEAERLDAAAGAQASAGAPALPERRQLADVMPLLDDSARPFTVAVISDSTGAQDDSWVQVLAQWLGKTYDRPVTLHSWAVQVTPNGYLPPSAPTGGANAPIEVWNGSASGKDVAYSRDHLAEMIPVPAEQVDLLFFSHGHNVAPGRLVQDTSNFLLPAVDTYRNATVVVMLQNPERPDVARRATHEANVAGLAKWAAAQGFPVIDGHAAVLALDGWETEYADDTGLHPSARAHQAWAQAVIDALEKAGPA